MNLRFKTSLLEHIKSVGSWARANGANALVDAVDFSLTIAYESRRIKLSPQFVGRRDGKHLIYFNTPDRYAIGFVGWLPYGVQAWDISLNKLEFKKVARGIELPTPAYWQQTESISAPFLVKRTRGAFGDGMRGPYRTSEAAGLTLRPGEYCEEFKWGRIARAWYWGDRLSALEIFDMPQVTGDGVSTYEALLRHTGADVPEDFASLARMQGIGPSDVLAAGRKAFCDYRYVSPFNPTLYANHNLLPASADTPLVQRFSEAGRRVWPRIPSPASVPVGFVLDAIVDAQGDPWFLEINSNPQWHPDIYPAMLDAIFAVSSN